MRRIVILFSLIIAFTVLPARAQIKSEIDTLRELIEQQQKIIEALEQRFEAMEAGLMKESTERSDEVIAEAVEQEEKTEVKKGLADYMDVYGSLRVRTGIDSNGVVEVDDNVSRLGINGELPLGSEKYSTFGAFEVGIRMASSPNQFIFNADPGGGVGQDEETITSRLGFAGLNSPYGTFSLGKQNSTYYDVAGWTTDQSYVFGGEASGAYNNGTDGGVSGTGRADKVVQYRVNFGPTSLGLQAQNRNSPNNANREDWGDALGGSLLYRGENGLSLGVGYQEVRDGVLDPGDNLAALDDTATIFGVRYQKDKLYIAGVYSITDQHETDDQGNFFDGTGVELYGNYLIGDRIKVEGGWVYLDPDSGQVREYQLNYGYAGIGYLFGDIRKGSVWVEYRFDDSVANDGSELRNNLLSAGVTFDF